MRGRVQIMGESIMECKRVWVLESKSFFRLLKAWKAFYY